MKRIISNVMLVAAAATAFFSCQKQDVIEPATSEEVMLTFSSEKPTFDDETKTEWTGSTIQWSAGDKIRIAYTCDGVWQNADGTSESDEENGSKTAKLYESKAITETCATAFFSVPVYFKGTAEGVYEFYGIYPSSLVSSADIKYAPSVTITIPTTQTPTASSFDSNADVMASKSQSYVCIPKEGENNGPISLKWERLVAHGHFTLKNLAVGGEEDIQTITLTANADADMVGTHYLYLDTYNVVKPNSNAAPNSITIDARNLSIDSEGNVTFWASFLPCTWTSIVVKVETDKASYTREIDLSSNQKTFAKNARNILAVNMASAQREAKSSNPLPFVKDFSDKTGTDGFTELDGFTVSGSVYNASGAIRLAKVDAPGSITTQPLDLSGNFHVKVIASGWDSDEFSLIVSSGNQSETITLSAVGNGNNGSGECAEHIINFQPVSNSSSVTFAAEAGKRCYIKKIEILEGHAVAAPVLKADTPTEIAAEGGEGSFTFTLENPKEGGNVTAVANIDWITDVTVGDGHVTYNVAENTSDESREGTVTLSYEGAQSVNIVITQKGKVEENVPVQKSVTYTVASASSVTVSGEAPAGSAAKFNNTYTNNKQQMTSGKSQTYTLSGYSGYTITGIKLSMKSNSSGGAGSLSVKAGSKTIASIADSKFNTANWNGSWSTSFVDIEPSVTETLVGAGEDVVVVIKASANSLYCQSITITYESTGNVGGGETPEPDPTPDPEQPGQGGNGEPTIVTMTSFSATSASMDSNVSYSTAKGGGTSEPAINSGEIRLYQNSTGGGSITITVKDGYKLQSVTIGSSMKTKVAYTKGDGKTKSATSDLAADGKYTVDEIAENSITFHCMGSDKNSRLYVNYLSVTYQAN